MTITLDPIKHTGAAPEPIVLLAEAEQLTFTGATLTDNMAATILSPTGTALASGLIVGNAVTLDTRTSQAWDYISAQACGVTAPALLAIGDADTLVAVMPIRVLRNNLYNLAPPSETVTVYPSMEQLREILAQIATADASAEDLLSRAEALGVSIAAFEQAFPGMVSGAVTEVDGAKIAAVEAVGNAQTAAVNAVTNAQTGAVQAVGNAQTTAVNAVADAQTAAVQAVQNKATEVSGEFDGKVTAAQNAATAASGHATAAANSASAALQSATIAAGRATAAGQSAEAAAKSYADTKAIKTELQDALTEAAGVEGRVTGLETSVGAVVDAVEVVDGAIVLEADKAYYKSAPTEETAYNITLPEGAEGIIDFKLLIELESSQTLRFPSNVEWQEAFAFSAGTRALVHFTSCDGGTSWIAKIEWNDNPNRLANGTIVEATIGADNLLFAFGRWTAWNYSVYALQGHTSFIVDWGDGTKETYQFGNPNSTGNSTVYPQHTYAEPGIYRIIISDDLASFLMANNLQVTRLIKWGNSITHGNHLNYYGGSEGMSTFARCTNLSGQLPPYPASMLTVHRTFFGCSSLSGTIPAWNETITTAAGCYYGCLGLSGTIPAWNETITNASYCYYGCSGLSGVWNPDATDDELMPERITSFAECVLYAGAGLRAYFLTTWGGTRTA